MRKSELRDIITFAEKIIRKENLIEMTSMLVYRDGRLFFTDLEFYVDISVGNICLEPFAINREIVKKVLSGKDGDITFTKSDDMVYVKTFTGAAYKLRDNYKEENVPKIRIPLNGQVDESKLLLIPKAMNKIKIAMGHVDDDHEKESIQGIFLNKHIVGTNGRTLYHDKSDVIGKVPFDLQIKSKPIEGLLWFSNQWGLRVTRYSNSMNVITFFNEGVEVRYIMSETKYPNYEKVLPVLDNNCEVLELNRDMLLESIGEIDVVGSEKIILKTDENELTLIAENEFTEVGVQRSMMSISNVRSGIFTVRKEDLKKIVQQNSHGIIEMKFKYNKDQTVDSGISINENWVLLPVVTSGETIKKFLTVKNQIV